MVTDSVSQLFAFHWRHNSGTGSSCRIGTSAAYLDVTEICWLDTKILIIILLGYLYDLHVPPDHIDCKYHQQSSLNKCTQTPAHEDKF